MRFWFVHSTEVSLQQQIVTQVSLGILAGELVPGERLPSIRELARRFHLHPNTVSAGYRQLEREHWVSMRKGSGVYVRESSAAAPTDPRYSLDQLLQQAVRIAANVGMPLAELERRLRIAHSVSTRLLLVEPEPALQQIVLAELRPHLRLPIEAVATVAEAGELDYTIVLVLPSKAEGVRQTLPPLIRMQVLAIRSIPASLAQWLPARPEALVAVASHWPRFLTLAQTMLVAAGFAADAILTRDATQPGWHEGLDQTAAVISDSYTATLLPAGVYAIPFPLIAESSLTALAGLEVRAQQESTTGALQKLP